MDLGQQLEAEHRRLQERSQMAHLQGQVDELRHRLDQQAARAQLASEQARQVQDMFSQLEAQFEVQVGEARQQEQARLRAYQSLKKEVAELQARMEEPARQILSLMARLQDVQEGLRLAREQVGKGQEEQRQLTQRLEEVRAQGLLWEERLARLDGLIGRLLEAEEERQQVTQQVRGEVEAERQNLRRQAADVDRLAVDLRGESQELLSRLNRLTDLQRQSQVAMEGLEERFDSCSQQLDRLAAELQRTEREAIERSLQGQERLEDLRQSVQREWDELRAAEERRIESQNTWLQRIEELYHGLEERLVRQEEEINKALVRLETQLGTMGTGGQRLLRSLLDLFQGQLAQEAEERLRWEEAAGEE